MDNGIQNGVQSIVFSLASVTARSDPERWIEGATSSWKAVQKIKSIMLER
jgi:hypothetical protein